MKTIEELHPLIIEWAREKDLLKRENAEKQYLKFLEEVGETARAILKNDVPEIVDGLGDCVVTIFILAEQNSSELWLDLNNKSPLRLTIDMVIGCVHIDKVQFCTVLWLNKYAKSIGYDLTECLNSAWDEIKDREGRTVNGTFVKA